MLASRMRPEEELLMRAAVMASDDSASSSSGRLLDMCYLKVLQVFLFEHPVMPVKRMAERCRPKLNKF